MLLEIPRCIKPFSIKVGSSMPNRCDASVFNLTVCYTVSQFRIVSWLSSVGRTVFSSISLEFDSFPLRSVLNTTVCVQLVMLFTLPLVGSLISPCCEPLSFQLYAKQSLSY